ncbi:hypothetical protein OQI_18555 [Streptomyces pharetrae CZA14]|uniref:Uncharacterized protein n=1 Tax=Streptomyces pharetrae CZA14 TaxID=1144883 RepID=A0ABX3YGI4_9ACTN|nr:hypothetical protein OQI_18555 [Streptomyces pharetrae CZA14]
MIQLIELIWRRKPRHSSSLTLGLSSRCGRILEICSGSKQYAGNGIRTPRRTPSNAPKAFWAIRVNHGGRR